MRIDNLGANPINLSIVERTDAPSGSSFAETVKKAISDVNDQQNIADDLINKLASGEPVEIHQAMIEMQKAINSFQLTTQVRNKILDAYQEIMRMQV